MRSGDQRLHVGPQDQGRVADGSVGELLDGALHFGTSGDNRFDDPEARYGAFYAARALEGAFAETCLRAVGARFVPLSRLEERSATELAVAPDLGPLEVHGPALARIGATAAVTSGTYNVSQPWSRAIHEHPAQRDGIVYRSNHDNGQLCLALFERCQARLRTGLPTPLKANRFVFARLLNRYKMGRG